MSTLTRGGGAENVSREWSTAGADVLLRAVLETAEIVA